MEYAVELKNVTKKFKEKIVFENLNLNIEQDKIYALLGRNGVGKTTLMNIITTKYLPNEGEVNVLGEKAFENENVLGEICFMKDKTEAVIGKKVKDIFKLGKIFYDNWDEDFKEKLLKEFEINEKDRYENLSKGKQSAVAIIIGLASRCKVTMLDEIYTGLDAVVRKKFYKILLEDYMENPRTFIISTHLIGEMSNIFSNVIIMGEKKLLVNEDIESLRKKVLEFTAGEELEKILEGKNILKSSQFGGQKKIIAFDDFTKEELNRYKENNISIKTLSLQDIFIALTEK
ncbi:MAG: ABC transporter ATP-binding protein [Clostridium sp.]|nr:ABC transporter ATP-binding protein [Clostridium sp.]MCI7442342.1 ABC transporter ATP-binding protein [Clostridium sp.]